MNRIINVLGSAFLAEFLSLAACCLGIAGINRPVLASAGLVAGALALLPLMAFGRQRYCITGLFITMLVFTAFVLFVVSWVRFFTG